MSDMKKTFLIAVLIFVAGIAVYAWRDRLFTQRRPVTPIPPKPSSPESSSHKLPESKPLVKRIEKEALDLKTVLDWFEANNDQLKGAPPTVVGFAIRAAKDDTRSKIRMLIEELVPNFNFKQGDVFVGFYDRETKMIQKEPMAVLYRTKQLSKDLEQQFAEHDLIIFE